MTAGGAESWTARLIGIDLRSLAALRIVLAAIQIGMLGQRFLELPNFFTDSGVLPNEILRAQIYGDASWWSVYFIDGSYAWTVTVWSLHMAAAVAMLVGWRTKWAIAWCLIGAWSLHVRNPFILTAGDVLWRALLAWLLLLPCRGRWSLDARRAPRLSAGPNVSCSWASMGIIAQLTCLYFFAGVAKWNTFWWEGRATEMALQLEMHVTPLGERLLQWPNLLAAATWCTLVLELVAPLLLWSPWRTGALRSIAAVLFGALHVSVWLTMSVGWFSAIALCAWIVLVPSVWWDRLARRRAVAEKTDGQAPPSAAQVETGSRWADKYAAALLMLVLAVNFVSVIPAARGTTLERLLIRVANVLMVTQEFKMFGMPPLVNPTFQYSGTTVTGGVVDPYLATGGANPSDFIRPYDYMQSHAWRRYHWHLTFQPGASLTEQQLSVIHSLRKRLLAVVVERYQAQHAGDTALVSAELKCRLVEIRAPRDLTLAGQSETWSRWP